MILDESLFESNDNPEKLYAYLVHSTMTDNTCALISDDKSKITSDIIKRFKLFITGEGAEDRFEEDDDEFEEEFSWFIDNGFLLGFDDEARNPWVDIWYNDFDDNLPKEWFAEINGNPIQLEIVGKYSSRF